MRPVRMKKWVRVGVLLLLVCLVSLGVVSLLYGRVDMLMAASSPHRSGARHARLQQALDGLTRIKGHKDNLYRLNKATSKTSKGITLAVVEEHHEVIPYWFKAAMMGKIPKTGNTLIHIDGHSDIGPPHYDPKMPFFHWPNTEEQMRHLMQANDVFIQAAMIAGLISRFIFISPSWDKSDNTTYARIDLDIGSLTLKNSKEQTFCCCMFVPSERKKQCAHYESALVDGNSNGASEWIDIISDRLDGCKMRRHCRGEQAVDHAALKMLKTKRDWIGGSGNIILDIDEDYFGVELPGESLADAGLKWDLVMQLQHSLSDMFCPKHITHEGLSNIMMREVIGTVIRRCQPSGTFVHDTCRTSVGRVQSVVHNVVIAYRKRHPQLFCTTQTKRLVIFSNTLTFILHQFKLSHLRLLMDLGVCLRTTPASLDFRVAGFGTICICLGANTPNSSVVFLHKPDAAEIRTRTTQLRKMLELIDAHHRPNIVTLCRSVRDGYTPRSLFSSIEANILGIFEDLPGHYDVVYDENLYGGKGGWPDRNKKIQVNSITKTRRGNRGV